MSSSKPIKKHTNQKRGFVSRHILLLSIASIVLALILLDLSPFGGNARFYYKWIECGQKPVSERIALVLGSDVPSYIESKTLQVSRMQTKYFCTPLEAEQAGYSASPTDYEFPHLKQK